MWYKSRAAREWQAAVEGCLRLLPEFYPAIDPVGHIPSDRFRELAAKFRSSRILAGIVERGEAVEREVPVHLISGVGSSSGDTKFDLGRLPESMRLHKHYETGWESFGPLNEQQMNRLWKTIVEESGAFDADKRIRLTHQLWDNRYIVRNTGTSRRIALWLRLQNYVDPTRWSPERVRSIPARIEPLTLNKHAVAFLRCEGRVLFARHSEALCAAVRRLEGLEPRFGYVEPQHVGRAYGQDDDLHMAMIEMPRPDVMPRRRLNSVVDLSRWCEPLFDLGRYFAERSATYKLQG